jgi:hypothetical protein
MYTPEQLSTFNAQIRAAIPSLSITEAALKKAQTFFDKADSLRKQMREADLEADGIRGDIHAMKMTIKRVDDFYEARNAKIKANEDELNIAFAKDIENARRKKEDGSDFVQLVARIKAIARMDLEDLKQEEIYAAQVAIESIKNVKNDLAKYTSKEERTAFLKKKAKSGNRVAALTLKSEEVNRLAAEAYRVHAKGLAVLKEAGLPADACKRKPEIEPEA